MGSPPRVRGTDEAEEVRTPKEGITPARAGNRGPMGQFLPASGDHPRACGEQAYVTIDIYIQGGSPPRVRGTDFPIHIFSSLIGITPARAGNRPGECG